MSHISEASKKSHIEKEDMNWMKFDNKHFKAVDCLDITVGGKGYGYRNIHET